jgi:hypothetical protein
MPIHRRKDEVDRHLSLFLFPRLNPQVISLFTRSTSGDRIGGPRNSTPHDFPNALKSSRLGFVKKTWPRPRKTPEIHSREHQHELPRGLVRDVHESVGGTTANVHDVARLAWKRLSSTWKR